MQDDKGLRRVLSRGWLYALFQSAVGAKRARTWLAETVWRCTDGEKVVDIGCGTGDVLEHLPAGVRYVGLDISENYINLARQRFGNRGVFLVGAAGSFLDSNAHLMGADLVVCNGLLHHLNDEEVVEVFQLAERIMRPNARLVCLEPTYLEHQSRLSRWVMNKDRGKNIRSDAAWNGLARAVFQDCATRVVTGLLLLPYTHIVIECEKR